VIFVDGEEDLAVIPLVIAAPDGAAILYGQPGKGSSSGSLTRRRSRKPRPC
jgi:uncharacterized protein (UPF0218 family)